MKQHGDRKPNRKSVTEPVSTAMATEPVSLKPVWEKTGFTETGFVRPGETGFTQIETGFVELAKPVSVTGFVMGVGRGLKAPRMAADSPRTA